MIMSNHDKLIVIIHMNRTSFDALADAYEWLRLLRLGPFGWAWGRGKSQLRHPDSCPLGPARTESEQMQLR